MRFFPRSAKSRQDAALGPGHIGNHGAGDQQTLLDRFLRYRPDVDTQTIVNSMPGAYGGSGG